MRRRHRSDFRIIRFLAISMVFGGVVFTGMWLLCLLMVSGFSVMGVDAQAIAQVVFQEFLGTVIWVQVKILAAYVFLGAVLGILGGVIFLGLFYRRGKPVSRWWAVVAGIIFSLVVQSLVLLWSMRYTPQLFADMFYLPGGWTRQLMITITDQTSGWIAPVALLGLLILVLISSITVAFKSVLYRKQWGSWIVTVVAGLSLLTTMWLVTVGWRSVSMDDTDVPGIIVLASDSFRFDHFSGNGYFRQTTPTIDSLMQRGTTFANAITPLPRTFPAWLSYLTGTYPHAHGIRHMFPTVDDREHIPPAVPEILGDRDWHSGVFTDFAGDIFSRVDLGFQTVKAPEFTFVTLIKMRSLEIHWALLPYVNTGLGRSIFPVMREFAHAGYPEFLGAEARHYIRTRARKQEPFFLLVFFSANHFPYSAPDPYYRMFADPEYDGDFKYHKPNLLKASEDLTTEDIEHILALYDGAIRSVDDEINKILVTLRKTGRDRNTWIVITSDHGENLYEGEMGIGHGEHLRGSNVVRIPLIIVPPLGWEPATKRVDVPVSGIDIAPSLLEMAGVPENPKMVGLSLLPLMQFDDKTVQNFRTRPVFSETGLWFADWTEGFFQDQRVMYPDISKLSRLDTFHQNQIVLKGEAADLMEVAKHRMVVLDSLKLLMIPTRKGVSEEGYILRHEGEEIPADPADPMFDPLRNALVSELINHGDFETMGDYFIPIGWHWRLNRRLTMGR